MKIGKTANSVQGSGETRFLNEPRFFHKRPKKMSIIRIGENIVRARRAMTVSWEREMEKIPGARKKIISN